MSDAAPGFVDPNSDEPVMVTNWGERVELVWPWHVRLRWFLQAIWEYGWAEAWRGDEEHGVYVVTRIGNAEQAWAVENEKAPA